MRGEDGYTAEEATGAEKEASAPFVRARLPVSRLRLSTQQMYEMKTKLRCYSERSPWRAV